MANFNEVFYWVKNYGVPGVPDKKAVENFVACEIHAKVQALRGQLYTIAKGKYDEKILDQQIGQSRKKRHGSYEEWAKMMLLWLSSARG